MLIKITRDQKDQPCLYISVANLQSPCKWPVFLLFKYKNNNKDIGMANEITGGALITAAMLTLALLPAVMADGCYSDCYNTCTNGKNDEFTIYYCQALCSQICAIPLIHNGNKDSNSLSRDKPGTDKDSFSFSSNKFANGKN